MYNFNGCKCPVCEQPLAEGDDIVVCPECGAPYHRHCYEENHGCCFADRHDSGFEWKPEPSVQAEPAGDAGSADSGPAAEVRCPSCGAMNPETSLFCESCGAPLHPTAPGANAQGPASYGPNSVPTEDPFHIAGLPPEAQIHPDEELGGIQAKDWAAYLGTNSTWYLFNFKRMQVTGHKFSLCLSAFFFGPFYFFYRKMWLPAFSLLALNILMYVPDLMQMMMWAEIPAAESFSPGLLRTLIAVSSTVSLAVKFLCGAFSVALYQRIGAKRIKKLTANGPVDPMVLRKAGGTSKSALLVSMTVVFVVSYVLALTVIGPAMAGSGMLV